MAENGACAMCWNAKSPPWVSVQDQGAIDRHQPRQPCPGRRDRLRLRNRAAVSTTWPMGSWQACAPNPDRTETKRPARTTRRSLSQGPGRAGGGLGVAPGRGRKTGAEGCRNSARVRSALGTARNHGL